MICAAVVVVFKKKHVCNVDTFLLLKIKYAPCENVQRKMVSSSRLDSLNLSAGIVHTLVGLVFTGVAVSSFDNDNNNTIDTSLWLVKPTGGDGNMNSVTTDEVVGTNTLSLVVLIILFVFITAIFHFVAFALRKSLYTSMINNDNNWLRWLEYSVTATIMIAIISLSTGVKEFSTLVQGMVMNVVVMILGYVVEKLIKDDKRTLAFIVTLAAWILFAGIWAFITQAFVISASKAPIFVIAIYILMSILFVSFGVVQGCQLGKVYKDYSSVELSYIVLSFTAKILLAFLLFVGLFSRQNA